LQDEEAGVPLDDRVWVAATGPGAACRLPLVAGDLGRTGGRSLVRPCFAAGRLACLGLAGRGSESLPPDEGAIVALTGPEAVRRLPPSGDLGRTSGKRGGTCLAARRLGGLTLFLCLGLAGRGGSLTLDERVWVAAPGPGAACRLPPAAEVLDCTGGWPLARICLAAGRLGGITCLGLAGRRSGSLAPDDRAFVVLTGLGVVRRLPPAGDLGCTSGGPLDAACLPAGRLGGIIPLFCLGLAGRGSGRLPLDERVLVAVTGPGAAR